MSKYLCNITFRGENGQQYFSGREYSYSEYVMLRPLEKRNFSEASSYSSQQSGSGILDTAVDIAVGYGIASLFGSDSSSSSNSDSSFSGFDGGSFSGGGSSSDW